MDKSRKIALLRNIIVSCVYFILFIPLVNINAVMFPAIFPKIIFFQIAVEIGIIAWILLAVLDKRYFIVLKNPIFISLTLFISALFVTAIFGVDFQRSLWSMQERMTGIMAFLHSLLFFLLLSSIHEWRQWKRFIVTMLCVSFLVGFIGIAELVKNGGAIRMQTTLGNPIYVGVYALMNCFFAILLFLREKNKLVRSFSSFMLLFNAMILILAGSRGAFLLFGISCLFFVSLAITVKHYRASRPLKIILFSILVTGIIGFVLLQRPVVRDYIQKNMPAGASRLLLLNLQNNDRYALWHIGLRGFLEQPLKGWGSENYNYIFNKNFDPTLYPARLFITPWYDKSHNQVIDIMSGSGIIGLLMYLFFWTILIVLLAKKIIEDTEPQRRHTYFCLLVFFCVYFLQNLTVFDSPVSLIMFYFGLGFLYFAVNEQPYDNGALKNIKSLAIHSTAHAHTMSKCATLSLIIIVLFTSYNSSILPFTKSIHAISAVRASKTEPMKGLRLYKKSLDSWSFTNTEVRALLTQSILKDFQGNVSPAELKEAISFGIGEMEKSIKEHPFDVKHYIMTSFLYRMNSQFDQQYIPKGVELMFAAYELAPKRSNVLYELSEQLILNKDIGRALEVIRSAEASDRNIANWHWNSARIQMYAGNFNEMLVELPHAGGYPYENSSFWLQLAKKDIDELLYNKIIQYVNDAIRIHPNNGDFLIARVLLADKAKKNEEVNQYLFELEKINPEVAEQVKKKMLKADFFEQPTNY